jgi:hypothetical protein
MVYVDTYWVRKMRPKLRLGWYWHRRESALAAYPLPASPNSLPIKDLRRTPENRANRLLKTRIIKHDQVLALGLAGGG